jgi:hypothetical protein
MLSLILINAIASLGVAVLLVERGDYWPVILIKNRLVSLMDRVDKQLADMFECMICTGFWASLIIDTLLLIATQGSYFMWPISGLFTTGLIWFVVEVLNALDSKEE